MPTLVFLIDVDNTLLDNDSVKKDLDSHLQAVLGPTLSARFWDLYEQVRSERNVVDIPLALIRLREQTSLDELNEQSYLQAHQIIDAYPFQKALYPHALETLQHLRTIGLTIVVSDGDLYYQVKKIISSGIADAVEGRVLLYIHKQEHLAEILQRYPADHYAMIDDKPQILHESKELMGHRLTTVFVQQGKYAHGKMPGHFQPDIQVSHIGDLRNYGSERFFQMRQ